MYKVIGYTVVYGFALLGLGSCLSRFRDAWSTGIPVKPMSDNDIDARAG